MVKEVFEKDKRGFALEKKAKFGEKKESSISDWVIGKLLSSSANHFLTGAKGCGYSSGSFVDTEFGASSLNLLKYSKVMVLPIVSYNSSIL